MTEEIRTRVAGVTFANEDGTNRQDLLRGMTTRYKISLRDEACAEYPEAIGVYNARGKRLGFLPKNVAQHIRECGIDSVEYLNAKITFVGATLGKPIGMEISIEDEELEPMYLNKWPIPYKYTGEMTVEERLAYYDEREAAKERKKEAKAKAQAELDAKWKAEREEEERKQRALAERIAREAEEQRKRKRAANIKAGILLLILAIPLVYAIWWFIIRPAIGIAKFIG